MNIAELDDMVVAHVCSVVGVPISKSNAMLGQVKILDLLFDLGGLPAPGMSWPDGYRLRIVRRNTGMEEIDVTMTLVYMRSGQKLVDAGWERFRGIEDARVLDAMLNLMLDTLLSHTKKEHHHD